MSKLILLIALFSLNCFAIAPMEAEVMEGGDHVGNGGGLSESNFAFARTNLGSFISSCLQSDQCLTTMKEKKVAKEVLANLPKELEVEQQLVVLSGEKNPNFFFLDNNVRIARTGDNVGDKIYLNRDLLYRANKDGTLSTIDIPQAIGILFHELGHHTDEDNHDLLDSIGAKIGLHAAKESTVLSNFFDKVMLPKTKTTLLQVLTYSEGPGKERVLLKGTNKTLDLTPEVIEAVKRSVEHNCSSSSAVCLNIVGMKDGTYKPRAYYFSSASWTKVVSPNLDGRFEWVDVSISANTYHSLVPSSSYYHLKPSLTFRVKLDRLKYGIQEVKLLKVAGEHFFGVKLF